MENRAEIINKPIANVVDTDKNILNGSNGIKNKSNMKPLSPKQAEKLENINLMIKKRQQLDK